MAKQSIAREFIAFIRQEKKYWMIPLIVVLLAVGAVIVFASTSPWGLFVYPFF